MASETKTGPSETTQFLRAFYVYVITERNDGSRLLRDYLRDSKPKLPAELRCHCGEMEDIWGSCTICNRLICETAECGWSCPRCWPELKSAAYCPDHIDQSGIPHVIDCFQNNQASKADDRPRKYDIGLPRCPECSGLGDENFY
jgi:hypothetical protein